MMFTPHALDPWLDDPHLRAAVATQATVTSTNTVLKHAVQNNSTVPQILIAGEQTAGVGRHGKHFASPADAGLYLSYAFHPQPTSRSPRYFPINQIAIRVQNWQGGF